MSFINWKKCLTGPKHLLKLIAIILCLCVACYQLSECFSKILHPPVSTYYNFDLNETLSFPALTICRNPAFKTGVLSKYNISSGGPKYSQAWRNFQFSKYKMQDFFDEATYSITEVFPLYGFDTLTANVITSSFLHAELGKCFVFTPVNETTSWSSTGYSFYLNHTETERKLSKYGVSLSGYHVHIHDRKDVYMIPKFIDHSSDYFYIENGEDVRLNLRVQSFIQLSRKEEFCNDSYDYSKSLCETRCYFKRITEEIGCSTPWLVNENLPQCDTYNKTKDLINLYDGAGKDYIKQCNCPKACRINAYTSFLENRRDIDLPRSELSITFSTNIVTLMKEILGYDWNLFLSDLGGSLGFLLGISVIGIIGTLENFINAIRKNNEELSLNSKSMANVNEVETIYDIKEMKKIKPNKEFVIDNNNQYIPQKETHDFVSINKY
ncbi:acid-sensing ion channel 4-A [Onthophagus taurus]|uniref:acid-sensing ion channel 4-A n=1 Tax=Onthophagus taurus TaxID=166361 RepID=UPI000C20BFF5|nr:uncharacterized protein LOC111415704 [Onthophagus taurus]